VLKRVQVLSAELKKAKAAQLDPSYFKQQKVMSSTSSICYIEEKKLT
jgi:hypothetical protein